MCVCVLTCVGFWTPTTTSVFLDPARYVRNKRKEGEKGIDTSVFRSTAETAATHVMCVCVHCRRRCVSLSFRNPSAFPFPGFLFSGSVIDFDRVFLPCLPFLFRFISNMQHKCACLGCLVRRTARNLTKITKPLFIYLRSRTAITCRYIVVRDVAIFTNRPCELANAIPR